MSVRELTLRELAAEAALVLSREDLAQPRRRTTAVPTPRTIRYYARCGLVAPPIRYRGRTALYGRHHLRQLVAVKKLQAHGYSLDEIQEVLPKLDDGALRRMVRLTSDPPDSEQPKRRRDDRAAPGAPEARPADPLTRGDISGIRLDPRVVLLLESPGRPIRATDLEAIRVAAAPLVKLLHVRLLADRS